MDEREWVKKHKEIAEKTEEASSEKKCGCVSVNEIAEGLNMDPRTIHSHFEVMRYDKSGEFLDPDEKIFCTREGIKQLAKRMGIKVEGE